MANERLDFLADRFVQLRLRLLLGITLREYLVWPEKYEAMVTCEQIERMSNVLLAEAV